MKFFDYSEDERREWRESEVTKAFLAELREHAAGEAAAVLSSCRQFLAGPAANLYTGKHDGLLRAVELAGIK